MKIILNQDIPKVGKKYEVKNVADGHALNFLIPRGLAVAATASALKKLEIAKTQLTVEKKVQENLLLKNLRTLDGAKIEIVEKANNQGHLFAGLHKEQIILALKKQTGLDVLPEFLILEKPIKEIGERTIEVKVQDKTAKFIILVKKD
ncbi:MAG: large subunit ribosomal protein L9 [Parcubacteria group bacterium Gr01-1014_73]|nr:MAG: large subunit ribosomal protein L9 [Parcubacteria group bacterium Gr01-1014_73]